MQIQLVGVPSSGKTTLSKNLVKLFPEQYVLAVKKYNSISRLFLLNPLMAIRSVIKCLPVLPICVNSVLNSKVSSKEKMIALGGLIVNTANFIQIKENIKENNKIIIWDELFLQRALSIFAYNIETPNMKVINKYMNWAMNSSYVLPIFILSTVEQQTERLKIRSLPKRMRNMNSDVLKKVFHVQNLLTKKLIESVNNSLILDSTDNMSLDTDKLHSIINNFNESN